MGCLGDPTDWEMDLTNYGLELKGWTEIKEDRIEIKTSDSRRDHNTLGFPTSDQHRPIHEDEM